MPRVWSIVVGIGSLVLTACETRSAEEISYRDLELRSGSPREALVSYLESVRRAGWDEASRFCWSPGPPAAEVGFGSSMGIDDGYTLRLGSIESPDRVWYEVDIAGGDRWTLSLRSTGDGWTVELASATRR